jgi:hypothetical protein
MGRRRLPFLCVIAVAFAYPCSIEAAFARSSNNGILALKPTADLILVGKPFGAACQADTAAISRILNANNTSCAEDLIASKSHSTIGGRKCFS